MGCRIRVGTSGYSYPDWESRGGGAPGQGSLFAEERPRTYPFYPPGTRDKLEHYARHFDVVEINSTYYRTPEPRDTAGWARRTPPGFAFWVKVPGETTHRGRREAIAPFRVALAPLQDSGKLAGLLAQFPASFRVHPGNRRYLEQLRGDFPDTALAVEFRHRSWDQPATYALLRTLGLHVVAVDEPDLPDLFPRKAVSTGNVAYLRLHSRAAEHWYGGEALRYDYLYSEEELAEWLPWLRALREGTEAAGEAYVFFNNCKRGQAAQNARRLQALLAEMSPAEGPHRLPPDPGDAEAPPAGREVP